MIRLATISSSMEGAPAPSDDTLCDGWIAVKARDDRLEMNITKHSSAYLWMMRLTEIMVVDTVCILIPFDRMLAVRVSVLCT
jgi:hypothetical protein